MENSRGATAKSGHERQLSDESHSSSLSDCHDYEPQLEFDDTELDTDIGKEEDGSVEYLESPVSDGTIEENFEEELGIHAEAPEEATEAEEEEEEDDFSDIAKHGVVEVAGDDNCGRRVIVVSACKLPSTSNFKHDRFLRYLMYTLDQYVESDYSLVYFHHGLNSKNKPSLGWLWQAYKAFDRKYKKNLKALFLVHPSGFIKFVYQIFRPAISVKFGRKIMYVNYLYELRQHLILDQLYIPEVVLEYDKQLMSRNPRLASPQSSMTFHMPLDTQQFNVPIQFLKEHNGGDAVPHVVRRCVQYLESPDVLETEGLFRRSANAVVVKEVKNAFNGGLDVDFVQLGDPHIAAVLLKLFLREMPEPLLTFDLYGDVIGFQSLSKIEKSEVSRALVLQRLPEDNYILLKYIVDFLVKVIERSDMNKMNSSNLAILFGPNLVWSQKDQTTLSSMGPINYFAEYMLTNYENIFTK